MTVLSQAPALIRDGGKALTDKGVGLLKRAGKAESGPDSRPVFLSLHPAHILHLPDCARAEAVLSRDLAHARR